MLPTSGGGYFSSLQCTPASWSFNSAWRKYRDWRMLEMMDKKEMIKTQASINNDEIKQYHMGCDKFWGGNKHYVMQKIKDTHVEDFELSHRYQKTFPWEDDVEANTHKTRKPSNMENGVITFSDRGSCRQKLEHGTRLGIFETFQQAMELGKLNSNFQLSKCTNILVPNVIIRFYHLKLWINLFSLP